MIFLVVIGGENVPLVPKATSIVSVSGSTVETRSALVVVAAALVTVPATVACSVVVAIGDGAAVGVLVVRTNVMVVTLLDICVHVLNMWQ